MTRIDNPKMGTTTVPDNAFQQLISDCEDDQVLTSLYNSYPDSNIHRAAFNPATKRIEQGEMRSSRPKS